MTAIARRPAASTWPVEHDGAVRGWAAGRLTMQQACAKSGLTKGQIIGRAHRLKLKIVSRISRETGIPDAPPASQQALPPAGQLFTDGCAWPFGEPGKPGFHFCGAERASTKPPYCRAHLLAAGPQGRQDG